jgi:hypothetical protein
MMVQMRINGSIEGLYLKDGGGKVDGAEVGANGDTVSQSNESVDAGGLGGNVPVGKGEEGANGVDVDEEEVVLVVGGNAGLSNNGALVQVVPVLILVELVHNHYLLGHISSHVEGISRLSAILLQLIKLFVSSHSDGSVTTNSHHVLIGSKGNAHDEGVDEDWIVDPSVGGGVIAVSEPHEGVDLSLLFALVP